MPELKLSPGKTDPYDFQLARRCGADAIYVLERFRVNSKFHHNPIGVASRYYAAVQNSCGWSRVFLADAITGTPGAFTQLFRVPKPFDPAATSSQLKNSPEYGTFFKEKIIQGSFERYLLCPLPYDPTEVEPSNLDGPMNDVLGSYSASHDTPEITLLMDEIVVQPGKLLELINAKQSFFIGKVASQGWALIAAGTRLDVAESDEIVQLWTLPDANRLTLTMRMMTQSAGYRTKVLPYIAFESQQLLEPRAGK